MDVKESLEAYINATNTHQFEQVKKYLSKNAIFMFSDDTCTNMNDIQRYFEQAWATIEQEVYSISNVNWLYIHDTSATCTYIYHYEGYKKGQFVKGSGRATNVFVRDEGAWQLIHEHLSH